MGYVIIAFIVATTIALFAGLFLMVKGGESNAKYGNKLMVARVVFQGCAVALVVFGAWLAKA